jgi:steroid 5-alpha reductase family enzyme
MTVPYLAAMAVSLSVLMAGAFLVPQRTGNSGWVDTIWTFSLGLVGAGGALWPVGWLAYPVIALSLDYPLSYPWGWATLLAPVFMYWILVHVTGIPPLEAQMLRSRGDRYRDYRSRTSTFFPLPPQAQKGVVT